MKKEKSSDMKKIMFCILLILIFVFLVGLFISYTSKPKYNVTEKVCEDYQIEVDDYRLKNINNLTISEFSKFAPLEIRNLKDILEEEWNEKGYNDKYFKIFYNKESLSECRYHRSCYMKEYLYDSWERDSYYRINKSFWNIYDFKILNENWRVKDAHSFDEITIKNLHDRIQTLPINYYIEEIVIEKFKKNETRQNCTEVPTPFEVNEDYLKNCSCIEGKCSKRYQEWEGECIKVDSHKRKPLICIKYSCEEDKYIVRVKE